MTIKDMKIGESAVIDVVGGEGALRQHFLDMGVIPGAEVTVVKFAPMGDPVELRIHGYELTLRLDDAAPGRQRRTRRMRPEKRRMRPEKRPGSRRSVPWSIRISESPASIMRSRRKILCRMGIF